MRWYAEGLPASREQVQASIDSGLPALMDIASKEGTNAVAALHKQIGQAQRLLPAA